MMHAPGTRWGARTAWCALLLAAMAAVGQEAAAPADLEEARLAASRAAWADLPMIRVLDDLGITSEQATLLQPVLAGLQSQFRAIDARLAALEQAAAEDIADTKRALLAGKPAPTAANLWRFEQMREHARAERDDAALSAMAKVNPILTKSQQALLQSSDAAAPPGQPLPRPEHLLRAQQQHAAWQAQVQQTMMKLLQQSRGETNPQRYAQLAPQACLQAAASVTGLPATDLSVQALAKKLLSGLDQARRLNAAEVAQRSTQLAAAMVRAAADTLNEHPGNGQTTAARPPVLVTSADLDALLRYERTPLLLQSWVRERPAVLTEAGGATIR